MDIYWLSQIKSSEQLVVGDRPWVLSQLLQHGCPIMPGLVLGNNLFRAMLDSLDNLEYSLADLSSAKTNLDINDYRVLQSVAQRSRQMIQEATFPTQWQEQIFSAVQQLNCPTLILQPCLAIPYKQHLGDLSLWRSHTCFLDSEAVTLSIKRVWQEMFTAKSLFYWQKLGLRVEEITVAILIQPLKPARASGTIEVGSQILRIQATCGLISSLWRGDVKPDEYLIDRQRGVILNRHPGYQSLAYRPGNLLENIQLEDCLEFYLVEPDVVTPILNDTAIAQLIKLTTIVLQHQPGIRYLEWTLPQVEENLTVEPKFYLTQFNYRPAINIDSNSILATGELSSSPIEPLLTGLAAAPGNATATAVVIPDLDTNSEKILPDCILVTHSIAPHHLSLLSQVGGIITEFGGITSHGAIMARELKIPAIVNAIDATKILRSQERIFIDGGKGKVYRARDMHSLFTQTSSGIMPHYPIATKLMINLSQTKAIAEAVNLPVDGIGLLRSELMLAELLTSQSLENWQQAGSRSLLLATLTNLLRQFVSAFVPRPVFYRSIDWYAQDSSYNPMIGERGTYSYLLDSTLFDLELEAIATLLAEGYTNLNLILPFVRSVEEFKFCRRRLEAKGIIGYPLFQLWIMAEVPSVIFLLPEYIAAGVQGITIGTNDLTQLLLGVDRERGDFNNRGLNSRHPALIKAIAQLIQTAKELRIPCSICGQAPVQYPDLIDKLVEWGITSISVEAEAVATTYQAIARGEKRLLLKKNTDNY
ncbi:MAG: putative PEP-binding protein [Pleurocapsa sp.]